ncbi:MAG: hypothetical protein AAFV72_11735 [Cyanobacteria bacterium J06635_1]
MTANTPKNYYRTYLPSPEGSTPATKQWGSRVKRRPIGAYLFAPAEWVAKAIAWTTNPSGGAKYALYIAAAASFGLSVESLYSVMPRQDERPAAEIRFVPKPGVEDGADLSRLIPNPFGLLGAGIDALLAWLPFYAKLGPGFGPEFLVWTDLNFYAAILFSAVIQGIEARIIRRVSIDLRKRRLDAVKNRKVVDLSPQALAIAKVRAKEYEYAGLGDYAFSAMAILSTYLIEGGVFFRTLYTVPGISSAALLIYGVLNVFGFEVFWALASAPDNEELVGA